MITEENITLYPEPSEVFTDPSLAVYFKPLLTTSVHLSGKSYKIHLCFPFRKPGSRCGRS